MTPSPPKKAAAPAAAWPVGLGVAALVLLAVAPIVVGTSGAATIEPLWTTLRIAALEAFTLVFINIITGSFRPLFNRVVKGRYMHEVHQWTGLAAFALAAAHGAMAFVFGIRGYDAGAVWVAPAALALLAVTIYTAISRRRFRSSWRWIHRLNYLIFAAVFVHGMLLGADLRSDLGLRVWFAVCAVIVAAALAYRVVLVMSENRKRAESRGGRPPG